jgi:subtilase family serine protease
MRRVAVIGIIAILVLLAVPSAMAQAASPRLPTGFVPPAALRGPQAVQYAAAETNYGIFQCQVGLSVGQCYDPFQMRTAYNIDTLIGGGFDGRGKTIVIIDAFQHPNLVNQMDYFMSFYGLPPMNGGPGTPTFTQVAPDGLGPYNSEMIGWAEEISLDVEWAHAIAPAANIVLDLAVDNYNEHLLSALNDAINHHRGDVISMSFGLSDTCLTAAETAAWHRAFVNATRQGITVFASSGDEGAAQGSCDGTTWIQSTSSPASDPLVVAVGGTELQAADYCLPSLGCNPATHPTPGTWLNEIAWNEGPPYGDFQNYFSATLASGGGFSRVWDKPRYQVGTVHGTARGEPDVAYNAAVLHGVLTWLDLPPAVPPTALPIPPFLGEKGFYRFGGTSAGAPQWAALTAIMDQAAGHDHGFINAALYEIGQSRSHYEKAFHDITSGTNAAMEYDAFGNPVLVPGYNAGTVWDAVTGLGTPKGIYLVDELRQHCSPDQGIDAINTSSSHPKNAHGNGPMTAH